MVHKSLNFSYQLEEQLSVILQYMFIYICNVYSLHCAHDKLVQIADF